MLDFSYLVFLSCHTANIVNGSRKSNLQKNTKIKDTRTEHGNQIGTTPTMKAPYTIIHTTQLYTLHTATHHTYHTTIHTTLLQTPHYYTHHTTIHTTHFHHTELHTPHIATAPTHESPIHTTKLYSPHITGSYMQNINDQNILTSSKL